MPDVVEELHALVDAVCRDEPWTPRAGVAQIERLVSTQGRVWKLMLDDGELWCLKAGSRPTIGRESAMLGTLKTRGFDRAPEALAHLPGPPSSLLSTWVTGTPGDPNDVSELEALGRTLRRLHKLPWVDSDPLGLRDALELRKRAWLGRAAGLLDPSVCLAVADRVDPDAFSDTRRVLCHRDVTATNWVRCPDGEVWLLDFGQARPDVALWDLVKLAAGWSTSPHAAEAFFEGYGSLNVAQHHQLEQLVVLHGLQTAVWGREHADGGFVELGDAILRHALGG